MATDKNKIAQAIEDAYIKKARGDSYYQKHGINPVKIMSTDTGIELGYLFSEQKDGDAMTDWSARMYDYASLMKDLLVLIGRPGILSTLHPSNQERASFQLMRLLEFFQSLNDQGSACDWLTWVMLDQFGNANTDADAESILRNLHINSAHPKYH